jgi:hypothetical protein
MLELYFDSVEVFNEETETYSADIKGRVVKFEHSLLSVSKWEQQWCKSWFKTRENGMTKEQTDDYLFRCMLVSKDIPKELFSYVPTATYKKIFDYIDSPMSATKVPKTAPEKGSGKQRAITNELIYCWMAEQRLPVQYECWHLNRLLKLIELGAYRAKPPKKRKGNSAQRAMDYHKANLARRAKYEK